MTQLPPRNPLSIFDDGTGEPRRDGNPGPDIFPGGYYCLLVRSLDEIARKSFLIEKVGAHNSESVTRGFIGQFCEMSRAYDRNFIAVSAIKSLISRSSLYYTRALLKPNKNIIVATTLVINVHNPSR